MAKTQPEDLLDEDTLAAILGTDADRDESEDFALTDDDLDTLSDEEREAIEAFQEEEAPDADTEADADAQAADAEALRQQQFLAEQSRQLDALRAERQQADAALKTLNEQLLEGDLSEDDYNTKLGEALTSRDELTRKLAVAEHEAGAAQRSADQQWDAATKAFSAANPAFVSDTHFAAFNKVLGDVTEDPRFASLSFERQIETAAQQYAIQATALGHNLAFASSGAKPRPQPPADTGPKRPTAEDRAARRAPPTIAAIPADSIDPHSSNVAAIAARLERADPLERERIMSQLPDEIADQVLGYE